jgi:GNAT superfamily N-acetyltransferase
VKKPAFVIRNADPRDAMSILGCRREAILAKAAAYYDARLVKAWGDLHDGLVEKVEKETTNPGWIFLVAEQPENELIGFGILVPEKNELRAVYVRPNPCGKVGTQILAELLARAKAAKCLYLEADASINAEHFYAANGFYILSRGMHKMNTGDEMACVKMRIDFG